MGGRSSKISVYVIHAKPDDGKSSLTVKSNSIATLEKEKKSTSDRRRSSSKTAHMKTPPDSPVISNNKKGLGKMVKHSYQRTSEDFPWLLKSANFHNMTLGDFEFGRIIGKHNRHKRVNTSVNYLF
jgi:hypothetical protein